MLFRIFYLLFAKITGYILLIIYIGCTGMRDYLVSLSRRSRFLHENGLTGISGNYQTASKRCMTWLSHTACCTRRMYIMDWLYRNSQYGGGKIEHRVSNVDFYKNGAKASHYFHRPCFAQNLISVAKVQQIFDMCKYL